MQNGNYSTWIQNHPQIDAALRTQFMQVRDDFTAWFQQLYQQPSTNGPAWVPEHLEYSFSFESRTKDGRKRSLVADQYASGHLDWKDFDQEITDGGDDVQQMTEPVEQIQTYIPTSLSFSGMPHPRLWQMEDRTVDFGKIEASPTALLNLLLAEYGLTYSNDWFILPYELPINTICEIKGILITDVFGQNQYVRPAIEDPETDWQQFAVFHQTERANYTAKESIFYLPPAVGRLMEGEDLEKVNFVRDEMANMVWAIEQTVESEAGAGRMLKERLLH
jgi:hypothetical protein